MFTYPRFEIEIVRDVDANVLGWPERGAAVDESGLGCNRAYIDMRRLSWAEARRVLILEQELMTRVELAPDSAEECEVVDDELYESDQNLYGLDLGVASAVVSLSAAGCVPFSSCNGGSFGGKHHERYPLVVFYAPAQTVGLLIAAAEEAGIGLEGGEHVVAYADDVRNIVQFARSLISRSSQFTAGRRRENRKRVPLATKLQVKTDQLSLALE